MFCFSPCAPPCPSPPTNQERAELAAGRRHLEARQALYAELQTQLDNCPESVREQLQEQLRRVSFISPPSPGPRATRLEGREENGGTGPPVSFCTFWIPGGSVLWLGGAREGLGDTVFSFLLLQAVMLLKGAKSYRGKAVGWGQIPSPISQGPAPRAQISVAWSTRLRVVLEHNSALLVTVIQGG